MQSDSAVLDTPPSISSSAVQTGTATLLLFCLGHFVVDLYSTALGVLQPLLIAHFGLSLAQAGLLAGMLSFSSSVTQPFYGWLSDRWRSRHFTVFAPLVSGVFISTLGWAPNFAVLVLMVFAGGAGMASFHPQAAGNATAGLKANRGQAMAYFISAGTLGMAVGPLFFSAIAASSGLHGAAYMALPAVLATALLFLCLHPNLHHGAAKRLQFAALRGVWKPMTTLYVLVLIRSIVQVLFSQFLALYLIRERGWSLTQASISLSLYLGGGVIGSIAGGWFADRFGGKKTIIASMAATIPFVFLFLFTTGWLSQIALVISGVVLLSTQPVNIVMAQRLAPNHIGTVSALMMGFAWGMAGVIFVPLAGLLADHTSLQTAFVYMSLFPIAGVLLALRLREDR